MPRLQLPPDNCKTASDVMARAAAVNAFRAQARKPRPIVPPDPIPPVPAPLPPPVPVEEIIAPAVLSSELITQSVSSVIAAAAARFKVARADMVSDKRSWPLVRYRQMAMYVAYRVSGRSLPHIGRFFGNRDHTTILHGVRTVRRALEAGDHQMTEGVTAIMADLGMEFIPETPVMIAPWRVKRDNSWSDEDIAILIRMYRDEGRTAEETAAALSRYRSARALAMKALRLGIAAKERGPHRRAEAQ